MNKQKGNIIEVEVKDISILIQEFKRSHAIVKIIAFSGGSKEKPEEVNMIIEECLRKLKQFNIAILTGGSKGGIPEFATRIAKSFDMHIIGILPLTGKKSALPALDFDIQIFVPPIYENQSFWSDESALFASLCDAIVVIGGSSGTLIEVAHAMKINEKLTQGESSRLPIHIVPVLGVSGVSEILYFLPFKDEVKKQVLPFERIFTGIQAADYLINKLDLYESDLSLSNNIIGDVKNDQGLKVDDLISPKTLNGFRDILPSMAIIKEDMVAKIKDVFRKFGFAPIETPHLEYSEILVGKGSDEIQKQLYRFMDNSKRDVTLRFDHTVPLARFVLQHKNSLGLPFKRYAVGNVFRGESPQSGRYREFTQCDFDFIGTYSISADSEIVQVIYYSLKALKIEDFTIFLNNRKIMNGLCEKINISHKLNDVLHIVDKINKIGTEQVRAELMKEVELSEIDTNEIMAFISIRERDYKGNFFKFIEKYKDYSTIMKEGIEELEFMCQILRKVGISSSNYTIDFSVTRGLGYYTGIVYETTLDKLPQIGAVASGGRFDNLTKSFSNDNLPGVGASIGIDRLIAALEKLDIISPTQTPAKVLIANLDKNYLADSYAFADKLRNADIAVEVYPEVTRLGKQFAFANKKGHHYLIAFGENEAKSLNFTLANIKRGDKISINSIELLIEKLKG
ncbi:MAG: histidine--tRNA ligase [Lewinellaceae bacterium]|nr:histidine--tRNA ligase [Lewinellaceae bacterium]